MPDALAADPCEWCKNNGGKVDPECWDCYYNEFSIRPA